jgi:hypothetical protein
LGEAEEMATRESGGMAAMRCNGRIGVMASVTMNLACLTMFICRCYIDDGGNNGGGREVTTVEPSKGKPPVTSDSIVNLDQGVIRSITRSRYLLLLFILICIGISHCPSIDRLCARAFVVV